MKPTQSNFKLLSLISQNIFYSKNSSRVSLLRSISTSKPTSTNNSGSNPTNSNASSINEEVNTTPNGRKPPRPRLPNLTSSEVPDLDLTNPLLDFPGGYFNLPFPVTRPETVLSTQTENDTQTLAKLTGLSTQEIDAMLKRTLVMKRVVNMTAKGKIPSMYALVVVGNGNGVVGYGEGKHDEAIMAIRKATNQAIKNLQYVERYNERTIFHDIKHKFHGTHLKLMARPPGFGLRVNSYIHEICKCAGIHDLAGKVIGSRKPMNVIKATFEALANQRMPQDIAKQRGKKLVDVQRMYYGVSLS